MPALLCPGHSYLLWVSQAFWGGVRVSVVLRRHVFTVLSAIVIVVVFNMGTNLEAILGSDIGQPMAVVRTFPDLLLLC